MAPSKFSLVAAALVSAILFVFCTGFTGCGMGTPLVGTCDTVGASRGCNTACVTSGLQFCNYITNPDGSRSATPQWGVCVGADTCGTIDAAVPPADSAVIVDANDTDAGMPSVDAGTVGDAGMSAMMCDPALLYACTDVCGVPASGAGYRICDPAIGLGPCLPFSGSCTPVVPTDCPCAIGGSTLRCAVVVQCSTACGYGVQSWRDWCDMRPCFVLVTAPMCITDDAGTPAVDAAMSMPDAFVAMDAAMPDDAFVPMDAPVTPDAFVPPDAFVAPDAFVVMDAAVIPDAFVAPDAFTAPDAFVAADAFVAPDAFVPPDAFVAVDAFVAPDAFVPPTDGGTDSGAIADAGSGSDAGASSNYIVSLSVAMQASCGGGFITRSWDTTRNPLIGDVDRWDSTPGGVLSVSASEYSGPGAVNNTALCYSADPSRTYFGLTRAERRLLLGRRLSSWDTGATVRISGSDITDRVFFCWDSAYTDRQNALGRTDKSLWDEDFIRFQWDTSAVRTGCLPGTGP